jgi:hypothetical protein
MLFDFRLFSFLNNQNVIKIYYYKTPLSVEIGKNPERQSLLAEHRELR